MHLLFVAIALFLITGHIKALEVMEMIMPSDTNIYLETPFDDRSAGRLSRPVRRNFTDSESTIVKSMDMKGNHGYAFEVELVQIYQGDLPTFGNVVGMQRMLPLEATLVQRDQREYFGSLQCNNALLDIVSLRIFDREGSPNSHLILEICPESGIRGFVDTDNRPLQMPRKMEGFNFVFVASSDTDIIFETSWVVVPWPRMWYNSLPLRRYQEKYHLAFISMPLSGSRRRISVIPIEDDEIEHLAQSTSSAEDYTVENVNQQSIKPSDDVCAICLDEFREGASKLSTCSHLFHRACLNKWLDTKAVKAGACPTCKQG